MKTLPTSSQARKLTQAQIEALPWATRRALIERELHGVAVYLMLAAFCGIGAVTCALVLIHRGASLFPSL